MRSTQQCFLTSGCSTYGQVHAAPFDRVENRAGHTPNLGFDFPGLGPYLVSLATKAGEKCGLGSQHLSHRVHLRYGRTVDMIVSVHDQPLGLPIHVLAFASGRG